MVVDGEVGVVKTNDLKFDLRQVGEHDRLFTAALCGGELVVDPRGRGYIVSIAKGKDRNVGNWRDAVVRSESFSDGAKIPLCMII